MNRAEALSGGFTDPVFDSQAVFRCLLAALSRPGSIVEIPLPVAPPTPLSPVLGTIVCTLADESTPVWLDPVLASGAVPGWISFHTGAPVVAAPDKAAFALVGDPLAMPAFGAFARGTAEYPDRSTTLIVEVSALEGADAIELAGPGIRDRATLSLAPFPADLVGELMRNRSLFPRGIDILLVAGNRVVGLPRSVRVTRSGTP